MTGRHPRESAHATRELVLPWGMARGRSRTIAASEIDLLAELLGLAGTDGGERPIHPQIVMAILVSLSALGSAQDELEADLGLRTTAALSHQAVIKAEVRVGDTLHTETEFTDLRASASRPGQFILSITDRGLNDAGDQVMVVLRKVMMEARETATMSHAEGSARG